MNAIVCFSGGHSSALAAVEAVRRYGKNNTILLNHDISAHVEHKDIKRFKIEIADYCGIQITYANGPAMTPLEVCRWKKGFSAGNHRTFCTYYLKTKPFYDYLATRFPPSPDVHIIYGFDADEEERIYRRKVAIRAMGYTPEFPLAEWDRTMQATEDVGISRPIAYKVWKHANCIGCLKAGRQHWYCVYCLRPDIWAEAKAAETEIGYSIINGVWLCELEERFREMRDDKHICPTQKMTPQAFWAKVKRTLPDEDTLFPCDCAF